MKKGILLLASLIVAVAIFSQSPQAFKYQAVVRDNNGNLITNQTISLRFSIHTGTAGGTIVYQETQTATTNEFGLAVVSVGTGNTTIGSFSLIDWSYGNKYLETEIDPLGGNDYTSMGTSQMESVPYALYSARSEDAVWDVSGNSIFYNNGNAGIGTSSPATTLHIAGPGIYARGQLCITDTDGSNPFETFYAGNDYKMHIGYSSGTAYLSTVDVSNLIIQGCTNYVGNVGIGWNVDSDESKKITKSKDGKSVKDVSHKLTVANLADENTLRLIGPYGNYGHGAKLNFGDGDYAYLKEDDDDKLYIYSNIRTAMMGGYVGIGTVNPSQRLTVKGNIRVESVSTGLPVVELGEGLDYAEGFNIAEKIYMEPGTVLSIDPDNPGELTESKIAYDTKVAGIVAGAGNLGSGVKLGSGSFDCNVALAGRVYCNVDASYGEVAPGDLLTTSPTPGFAMIAKDFQKAQGAIIGKAMESLKKGEKKQILVLVTLQ